MYHHTNVVKTHAHIHKHTWTEQHNLNCLGSKFSILHDTAAFAYFKETFGNTLCLQHHCNSGYICIFRIQSNLSNMSI